MDKNEDKQEEQSSQNNQPQKTEYGLVKPRNIETEMQDSYLDYAMSVIVARALPDVRDGLKPVHRKVLYSMHELGLTSHAKYRKSATVVGDVLGKYHPHGDIAVYDTLVRLAQNFSMRYPLVDGQGNFGSMDGDNAAAMRYTEARLTAVAEEMLADIDKNTVNFIPNFDGSREEPAVLPAKVPQLLLNGTLGIAVGMATNIPPHNLGEIVDGTINLIDNPEITLEELMQFIPAPDFPTGSNIYNPEDIKTAYATGKGRVLMRAVSSIEEKKIGGFRIIVSEIPYQVNKADLISKIAELVKLKKIEGISDLRDESDRKEGVRIVIELKNNAYPKKILNQLYELTAMQCVFHINMLALIDGIQPKILTLKNVLEEFVKHRQKVIRRRTEFELNKTKERAHILEGLKKALNHIDEVINTIRKSETKEIAHKNLMLKFDLSNKQSAAILEMRLSALAGLERKKVADELKEKLELIKKLESILGSEAEILKIIKRELLEIKEKYADPRRSKIIAQQIGQFKAEDLIPNEQVIVSLTRGNYIKRVPVSTYRAQNRGGKGVSGMTTKEEDAVEHLLVTWTHHDIMFFTDRGRVFNAKVYDLPSVSRTAKGQAIVNILQIAPEEKVTAVIALDPKKKDGLKYFFMGTKLGVVKKTEIEAYRNVRKSGMIAIKINANDELKWVLTTSGKDRIIIISHSGQSIYFDENNVRSMGRSAAGVRGIKLRTGDEVISMNIASDENSQVFTILRNGFGKRTAISNFNLQKRGGIGIRASKVTEKTGNVVEAMVVSGDEGDIVIISKHGQVIRTSLKSVKKLGRDTQGVTLMRLNKGDRVASMTLLRKEETEEKKPEAEYRDKKIPKEPSPKLHGDRDRAKNSMEGKMLDDNKNNDSQNNDNDDQKPKSITINEIK
ncbi:DNA gyrase subunit A, partial [Candidatus Berkelbacteria bacterium RIFCSPHIGHO2_12_FULL_36_9]